MAEFFTPFSPPAILIAVMIFIFPFTLIAYAISFIAFLNSLFRSEGMRGDRDA